MLETRNVTVQVMIKFKMRQTEKGTQRDGVNTNIYHELDVENQASKTDF